VTVEDPVEYRLDGITQVQAIVEAMCFIVIVFLIVFVIPVFSKMYRQMHVPFYSDFIAVKAVLEKSTS